MVESSSMLVLLSLSLLKYINTCLFFDFEMDHIIVSFGEIFDMCRLCFKLGYKNTQFSIKVHYSDKSKL